MNSQRFCKCWSVAAFINFVLICVLYLEGRWLFADGKPVTHDFLPLWTAASYALQGNEHLIYSLSTVSGSDLPFLHPPHVLLLLLPFGAMRYSIAAIVFLTFTAVVYAASLNLILHNRMKSATMAIAGGGAFFNLWYCQVGFLTAALMMGGLALIRRAPVIAGVLFGLLTIKPHMGLAIAVALVVTRQWKIIFVAIATALSSMAVAMISFGYDIWSHYIGFVSGANPLISGSNWFKMQSLFAAVRPFFGFWAAVAIHGTVALTALGVMIKLWLSRPDYETAAAATIAATLLVTPYLFAYDATILTGAAAFLMARRLGSADMAMTIFACLVPLAALYLLSVTVPVAAMLILYIAARHSPPASAGSRENRILCRGGMK